MATIAAVDNLAADLGAVAVQGMDQPPASKHVAGPHAAEANFFTLPQELRDHIYSFLSLINHDGHIQVGRCPDQYWQSVGSGWQELNQYTILAATCRTMYQDATKIFFRRNHFYVLHIVNHKQPGDQTTAPSWLRRAELVEHSDTAPSGCISAMRIWGTEMEIRSSRLDNYPWDYDPALDVSWHAEYKRNKASLFLDDFLSDKEEDKRFWEEQVTEAVQVVIDRINHYLAEKESMNANTLEMVAKHWVYAQQLIVDQTHEWHEFLEDRTKVTFEDVDTPWGILKFRCDGQGDGRPKWCRWCLRSRSGRTSVWF